MADETSALTPAQKRQYPSPPVVEALCEVVFLGAEWTEAIHDKFHAAVRDRFPIKESEPHMGYSIPFWPGSPEIPVVSPGLRTRMSSADRSRVVQIGNGILVFNQLRPYVPFDEWSVVALEMCDLYARMTKADRVLHLGVRYINRIEIPGPEFKLEDYFRVYPEIPKEMAASHGPFLMRITMLPEKSKHLLLLSLGVIPYIPGEGADKIPLLLDVYDIAAKPDMTAKSLSLHMIEAHDNIRHCFEISVTDKTKAFFQGD